MARAASDTSGGWRIAVKFRGMQRLSNIHLIVGDTTAGTRPIGKGRRTAVREYSTSPMLRQRASIKLEDARADALASLARTQRGPGISPSPEGAGQWVIRGVGGSTVVCLSSASFCQAVL
jgi:hypothetical protein